MDVLKAQVSLIFDIQLSANVFWPPPVERLTAKTFVVCPQSVFQGVMVFQVFWQNHMSKKNDLENLNEQVKFP